MTPRQAERHRAIVDCIERGLTLSETARELGRHPSNICVYAKRHGLKFARHGNEKCKVAGVREHAMRDAYKSGKLLEEIGQEYGITRERVRQILSAHFKLTGADGGQAARAKRRNADRRKAKDKHYQELYGLSYAQWRATQKGKGTPFRAYMMQRKNAYRRGIGWQLSFPQWWEIWAQSGHWTERGRGQGYVMCRKGDEGPYAPGNVFIATARANSSNQKRKKSRLPTGVRRIEKGAYVAYVAQRHWDGTLYHIGSFSTPLEASLAYETFTPPSEGVAA